MQADPFVDYVYERDDVAQAAKTEARFQQLEQRVMDAIGALTKQVAALAVVRNPPRHHPYDRQPQEEDKSMDNEEAENPFVVGAPDARRAGSGGYSQQRGRGRGVAADHCDIRQWDSGLKIDLPEFQGGLTPEEFLRLGYSH